MCFVDENRGIVRRRSSGDDLQEDQQEELSMQAMVLPERPALGYNGKSPQCRHGKHRVQKACDNCRKRKVKWYWRAAALSELHRSTCALCLLADSQGSLGRVRLSNFADCMTNLEQGHRAEQSTLCSSNRSDWPC
ncbi:hypothetical protein K469DRAFT_687517 [Zopfia rhizophila CBS 207.26]|uniref:Uncharacterized protein n=1 Tax=Zopfia rhizophila CBS 207.26 TaxID=1314779 RepID=A0A6A6E8G1_9PEZI|nr:hypothetical protein K469DRAFT_687517 [Zopfia rhizophila CBS 207.26]